MTAAASASSLDGRAFLLDAPADAGFEVGGLVVCTDAGGAQVGQIDELGVSAEGRLTGTGTILGELGRDALDARRSHAFPEAAVARAGERAVELVHGDPGSGLQIGTLLGDEGVGARLLAHRFNRHTFWCGQSGSGKTYALGVVLEQLLVNTSLPMVIFDPNADFVRLREQRRLPAGSPAAAHQEALQERDIRILRPASAAPDALRVRFVTLAMRGKAAVLRLDPLTDRAEYNAFMHLDLESGSADADEIIPRLRSLGTAASLALADRVENLRVLDWDIWAGEHEAVTEILDERPDATVLDLGGFGYADESLVVAMAVLDDLWAKRESRRPMLIVIDEAHNLCSPDTDSPLHVAVRERIIQIAAEGRKFGLWLLLSTQRPSKVHPNIISQCDNLALMRMSSPLDLAELADVFGFAPRAMLERSPRFRQGEALFAGGFVAAPTLLKVGDRLTVEGGVDVPVPLR